METKKIKGIIKLGPTKITEYAGKKQIGFLLVDHDTWFNVHGQEEALKEAMKLLTKGNEIEFESDNNFSVKDIKVLETSKKETTTQTSNETSSSIVKIQGKDYMTYRGLLNKAHEKKEEFSMKITDSFVNEDMTMAWCKIRLTAKPKGHSERIFDGFGSSTPANTRTMTQSHPVEMAHTRAKGRALRDYLNIGQVMAEELAEAGDYQ